MKDGEATILVEDNESLVHLVIPTMPATAQDQKFHGGTGCNFGQDSGCFNIGNDAGCEAIQAGCFIGNDAGCIDIKAGCFIGNDSGCITLDSGCIGIDAGCDFTGKDSGCVL